MNFWMFGGEFLHMVQAVLFEILKIMPCFILFEHHNSNINYRRLYLQNNNLNTITITTTKWPASGVFIFWTTTTTTRQQQKMIIYRVLFLLNNKRDNRLICIFIFWTTTTTKTWQDNNNNRKISYRYLCLLVCLLYLRRSCFRPTCPTRACPTRSSCRPPQRLQPFLLIKTFINLFEISSQRYLIPIWYNLNFWFYSFKLD
jgi:hypothetical protein